MPKDLAQMFGVSLGGLMAVALILVLIHYIAKPPIPTQQVCRVEYIKQTTITTCWNEERK
jgi:hypothetical protein